VSRTTTQDRLALKTPEAAFLHVMQEEFNFSLRVSRELLGTAKEMLVGGVSSEAVRPGQVRLVVASLKAPFGPPLAATDQVEVTLTIDDGAEDAEVKQREGSEGLRQGRILRITEEALEQGGVLSQEDVARALGMSARTIRRDMRVLRAAGHTVQTRGYVKGVGRGQTHKVRVIELWLDRQGYDQIARWLHHSPQALKRYVSAFLRMVLLHRQGTAVGEIAFLTQTSVRLVEEYLGLYEAALGKPQRREKLEEELARVSGWREAPSEEGKKGALIQ
jgi:DNA-binding Lrp family transcriptional regulator